MRYVEVVAHFGKMATVLAEFSENLMASSLSMPRSAISTSPQRLGFVLDYVTSSQRLTGPSTK